MNFNLEHFKESLIYGLAYLPNTLSLVFVPLVIGLTFGTVIALVRVYKVPVIGWLMAVFVTVYQGIPIVVALMIYNLIFMLKFNDLAAFLHLKKSISDMNNIWVGIFALSMAAVCSISEAVRGALLSIDKGQNEAGYSVGLTTIQTIRRIIIPQMIPVAIPMLINNVVGLIKASSVVMAIGIVEIVAGATIPSSRTYSFFEGYVAAAVIYWGFTVVVESLAQRLKKYTGKFRRNLYD
ncbi:amino acid ABC transporter permease [Lacrimispora algidixylanolytica]|uniref:Amino acid ABC transporter permease n=1 Tax=Lacrimispora algidixylanolytica TaxID=94868 RepID=A0A419T8C0_9FIRM|nr:ABC transporter permease subunit [Lacrimispora algidixylanolytica]RKD33705.1 amino acid ABC transporter permease [Lacrimispora algidixylanolytica]